MITTTIYYSSGVAIGRPTGPGVNELEFIRQLLHARDLHSYKVVLLIVDHNQLPQDIRTYERTYYMPPASKVRIPGLTAAVRMLHNQKALEPVLSGLIRKEGAADLVILRPVIDWNLAWVKAIRKLKWKYVIKSLHDDYGIVHSTLTLRRRFNLTFAIRPPLRNLLQKALVIDTPQRQFVNYYARKLQLNVKMVPNAVNTDVFFSTQQLKVINRKRFGIKLKSKVVGYCGGVPLERGAQQMISFLANHSSEYPDVYLVIVGDSKYSGKSHVSEMQAMVTELGLSDRCLITGHVPYDEVVEYMRCFDIGIALDTAERVATYGNSSQKIFQYISCGIPCIYPQGTNEFLPKDQFGSEVVPENDESFGAAIKYWLSNTLDVNSAHQYMINYHSQVTSLNYRLRLWGVAK